MKFYILLEKNVTISHENWYNYYVALLTLEHIANKNSLHQLSFIDSSVLIVSVVPELFLVYKYHFVYIIQMKNA